jgi:hypothetical protein
MGNSDGDDEKRFFDVNDRKIYHVGSHLVNFFLNNFLLKNWEWKGGEGKTTYTFSVSVNAFSVEFPLACYQQAGRVWYVSGALQRTYTLFYPAPWKGSPIFRLGRMDLIKCT